MKPLIEPGRSGAPLKVMFWVLIIGLLAGCAQISGEPALTPPAASTSPTAQQPTHTATAVPPKVLNVCLAEEPESLYRYDGHQGGARDSVFAALYDGPFELLSDGQYASSIFSDYPTRENGGISAVPTAVLPGDMVVDAYGSLSVFKAGIFVRPSGCQSSACAVTWKSGEFLMDQTRVEFRLRPDALWSDGLPLRAGDAEFSYKLAREANLSADAWALERTASFSAEDDQTAVWMGVPGFSPRDLAPFFWLPMPERQFGDADAAAQAGRSPLGWGAYRLVRWESGKSIQLERNPYYFGLKESQPAFDQLNFLFVPGRDDALEMLASGRCDVLDRSYHLEALPRDQLTALSKSADLHWEDWEPVEQLVFGIRPASHDDGYTLWSGDRPDFFSDTRTRLALTACLQPDKLALQVLADWLPEGSDLSRLRLPGPSADPAALLDEVGWKDLDGDPTTPRAARGVPGVANDTPFSIKLFTSRSALHQSAAALIIEKLGACGVRVDWQALPVAELYAPGPQGVLFGRAFDLALVSWQPGSEPLCALYRSKAIPAAENYWVGTNLAGFSDPSFEAACADLEQGDGLAPAYPAAALLPHLSLWVSRTGLAQDAEITWNQLESLKAE